MDLSAPLSIATSGLHTPIPSNANQGGACYDGDGRALYGVYDTDGFKVYRTRGTYADLYTRDASVEYLSTILTIGLKDSSAVNLQRINSTTYAVLAGWFADGTAGTWIYRDTGTGGSGPWVLHGTVQAYGGLTGGGSRQGIAPFSSEILIRDGLWCVNAPAFGEFGSGNPSSLGGVYTSTDGGATWTNRLTVGWYFNGVYGSAWSRNFGQWAGAWYVGGNGTGGGQHFSSGDLVTWTSIGTLGTAESNGYSFPVSDPLSIYRWQTAGGYSSPRILQAASGAPEAMPSWVTVADTTAVPYQASSGFAFPVLCNVGPDAGLNLVAINWGKVLGIAERGTGLPPCRQYPREEGLASSSARRHYPAPRSRQGGYRKVGYY